jgi:hypothetical protein
MSRIVPIAIAVVAAVALGSSATLAPAQAQATTTFVSGHGFDTNPCTHTAPCRSFAAAVAATSPGGQVTMLDPAGYGTVTITKAISIVNDGGGEAGITDLGASQNAITINAGAGDVVTLRGLTLNGVGTGAVGIAFNSGGALNIQNCVIRSFAEGVLVDTRASSAVTIADTIVSDNADFGVNIAVEAGTVPLSMERAAMTGNPSGGIILSTANLAALQGTIVDSVVSDNAFGLSAVGTGTIVMLINSQTAKNTVGLKVDSAAALYISKATVAGNQTGFSITNAGLLHTFGDNYIIDTNNSGALTPIALQ